jgi:hypothetical protein
MKIFTLCMFVCLFCSYVTFSQCLGDKTNPVAQTKNTLVPIGTNGSVTIAATDVDNNSTDNCGITSRTVSPATFTCSNVVTSGTHYALQSSTNTGVQNYSGELGMDFNVTNAQGIIVTQLGTFDHLGNGINGNTPNGSIRVAVFNRNTKLIVAGLDVLIAGLADGLVAGNRVRNIAPVVLPVGQYTIVAKGYNQNELAGNNGQGTPLPTTDTYDGAISFVGTARFGTTAAAFAYPNSADGGPATRYHAGTFTYLVGPVNTVTLTVKDAAGNSNSKTAFVAIVDKTLPVINNCPQSRIIPNPTNAASVTATWIDPTAVDNCSRVTVKRSHAPGSSFPVGTTAVNYTFRDATGNESACTFYITVGDTEAPIARTKNIVVPLGADGTVTITPADIDNGSTDNVGITSRIVAPNVLRCNNASKSGNHYALQSTTNAGTQGYTGELGMDFDVLTPEGILIYQLGTFDHLGDGIKGNLAGNSIRVGVFNRTTQQVVPGLEVSVAGLADGIIAGNRVKNISPVLLPPGQYSIVSRGYNASELHGNRGQGSPLPAIDNYDYAINFVGTARYGTNVSSDFSYPSNPDAGPANRYHAGTFSYLVGGQNVVTLTVKDGQGNTDSKTAIVTVEDRSAPIVSNCPQDINAVGSGTSGSVVSWIEPAAADNCTSVSLVRSHAPGSVFPTGTTTVSYKFRDASGNERTCSFKVNVTSDHSNRDNLFVNFEQKADGIKSGKRLSISPNPSNGIVTIKATSFTTKGELIVTNANGKTVDRKFVQSNKGQAFSVDLTRNVPGIYFIKLVSANSVETGKIIIQ